VIAILRPSVLFGLAHVSNANATLLSTVNTMIFGVVFGGAYALTGELALPIACTLPGILSRPSAWVAVVTPQGWGRSSSSWKVIPQRGCGRDGLSPWRAGCWEQERWSSAYC